MRWDRLFDDLESQTEAELRHLELSEQAERSRYEFGLLTLRDRLESSVGTLVTVQTLGGHTLFGRLRAVGNDWVMLSEPGRGGETIVNLGRLLALDSLPVSDAAHDEQPDELAGVESLALRHLLRGLGRDRAPVLLLVGDGSRISGTIDRVARDHFELAVHPVDEARRARSVVRRATYVTGAIAAVRVET